MNKSSRKKKNRTRYEEILYFEKLPHKEKKIQSLINARIARERRRSFKNPIVSVTL